MKTKKIQTAFLSIAVIFFFIVLVGSANAQEIEQEKPFRIAGVTEGTGNHFEINDSEYLNIRLDSTENVAVRIESAPEMVMLEVKSSEDVSSTNLKFSGFSPNTTYHTYQDNYHNYTPYTTNDKGEFYFDADLTQDHIIFIQPRKSTKFIKDNPTGGDCSKIGSWDAASKTCTLTQDVSETIQIDNDNITLDGNGHTLAGSNTSSGVYVWNNNVTVKNITVTGFYYGIYLSRAEYCKINSVTAKNNKIGIELGFSNNSTVSDSRATENYFYGLILYYSGNNIVSSNTFGPGNAYGIQQAYTGNYNTYENNDISNNSNTGIITYGGGYYMTLRNNTVKSNAYDGMVISGDHHTLSGNIMSGNGFGGFNGKSNFSISGGDMSTNNIDKSNTVEGKPIYYEKGERNKIYDGSMNIGSFYCLNCDNILLKDLVLSEHASSIYFWRTTNSVVENIVSFDKSTGVYLYSSNRITVRNSDLGKIYLSGSNNNQVYNNNFSDIYTPAYDSSSYGGNVFYLDPPIGGNYWKKNEAYCKDENEDSFCDSAYFFYRNGQDRYPMAKAFNYGNPIPSCCSSVMFLPGHQASRLYKKHSYDEDRLWEPTNRNEDVKDLYLSPDDGSSVDPNIYTRDIIDEAYGVGENVYENYMESMNKLVGDGVIKEWKPIPYDWRMPLENIVDDGIKMADGEDMDIIEEVEKLAANSKTGKVTIVGHSNGGLLAKVLIDRLKGSEKDELVDRLIMVSTPQLGTPKAVAGMLHGDELNLLHGALLDKETARSFAENMVSAYNLLPSERYFDIVESPVFEFDEDVKNIYDFRSIYGENISSWDEFKKFMLGDDGQRSEPEESDTDSPNVLKNRFITQADSTHDLLDFWQAPEGMEVIQIAGWGLDTIRGIKYDDCDIPFCPDKLSNLDRSLVLTTDGDETVVVPSAVATTGVEKYYLNLKEHNEELLHLRVNRNHASILEVSELQEFVKSIIQNSKTLSKNITLEKPIPDSNDKRWRFRLHSPVSVDLYTTDGSHTGLIENKNPDSDLRLYEEKIPNSYYIEFGEKKYAGSASATDIVLTGEDLGTFTFDIDQIAGERVEKATVFSNIPVMKNMKATLSVSDSSVSEMKIDVEGDGQIDATFNPGEEISKEDLLQIFEKIINSLKIEKSVKDRLINKIDNAKKQIEKGHGISSNAMLENVKQQIRNFSDDNTPEKFRIPKEDAEKLIGIMDRIQAME